MCLVRTLAPDPRNPLLPSSSLFSCDCALFSATAPSQPLFNQSLPHSFPCNGEGRVSSTAKSLITNHSSLATSPITPLECALASKHSVLPGFGRSCPSATPLESALTETTSVNPLECAVPKKGGGEGNRPSQRSPMKGELRGLLDSLRELPAEAALNAEIPLRDGMLDRRTHFHDLPFLRVHG